MTQTATHPIERILPQLKGVKEVRSGKGGYVACCPAHNDRNPSLMVWEDQSDSHVGLKCLAGCSRKAVVEAIGLTEADLYVNGKASQPAGGIELFDLAADKLIHPHLLDSLGITDGHIYKGKRAIYIPYKTQDGKPYERYRIRTALAAKYGSCWSDGEASLIPYGLEMLVLARASGYLVIVEGESDCWTLWQHKFPALGVPGAKLTSCIKPEHLEGIARVYIMQESDQAGQKFTGDLHKHLQSIGYKGTQYVLTLDAKDPNELHKRDINTFKAAFQLAIDQAKPMVIEGPTIIDVSDLLKEKIPPLQWIVRDILPEGLSLLAGKPKLGKSLLALSLALGICQGGFVLGKIAVEQGQVLYLDIESNKRRLQSRTQRQMGDILATLPKSVFFASLKWPRADQGGITHLEQWIKDHPAVRLIIIDTWGSFGPRPSGKARSLYEEQYDSFTPLRDLANTHHIAILGIVHARKMASPDDVLDEISGTTGIAASVNSVLIMKRERGQHEAVIHVTGHDIEEETAYALNFDQALAMWTLEGKAEEFAKTKERQAILTLLEAHPNGLKASEIADKLSKNIHTIRNLLSRLLDEQKVMLTKYIYTLIRSERSEDSESSDHSERSEVSDSTSQNDSEPHHAADKPHYVHYDALDTVVRFDALINEPVESIRSNGNENLTTLTTVNRDPTLCHMDGCTNLWDTEYAGKWLCSKHWIEART